MVLCILLCMRLNITVDPMKLKRIDSYCQEKKVSRSSLLVNSTLGFINAHTEKIFCEKCNKKASIGKFKLTIYNWENGEQDRLMQLCQTCFGVAKTEGVAISDIL